MPVLHRYLRDLDRPPTLFDHFFLNEDIPTRLFWCHYSSRNRWKNVYPVCNLSEDELFLDGGRFSRFDLIDFSNKVILRTNRDFRKLNWASHDIPLQKIDEAMSFVSEHLSGPWSFRVEEHVLNNSRCIFQFKDAEDAFHFKLRYG